MGIIDFIRNYPNDCTKLMRVIDSCKTHEQLSTANRMVEAIWNKWDNLGVKNQYIIPIIVDHRRKFGLMLDKKTQQLSIN